MKMNHLRQIEKVYLHAFLLAACLLITAAGARAQTAIINLSLDRLDNKQARLYGPGGVDTTFSTKNAISMALNTSSTYSVEVNPDALVALVQFDLGQEGNITAVRWKDADESQTGGGFQALDASYHSIVGGYTLELTGAALSLNYADTDLGGIYLPEVWLSVMAGGANNLALFPGDYVLQTGASAQHGQGASQVSAEVQNASADAWGSAVKWRLQHPHGGSDPGWATLPAAFHSFGNSNKQLNLLGKDIYFDYAIDNKEVWIRPYNLQILESRSVSFFPGNLDLSIGSGDGLTASVAAIFEAAPAQIGDTVLWIDGDSSLTQSPIEIGGTWIARSGDTLRITGTATWLDLLASDNAVSFENVPVSKVAEGIVQYRLFPGDYLLKVTGTATRIEWDQGLDGEMGAWIYSDHYDPTIPVEQLHRRFFQQTDSSRTLSGYAQGFDLQALPQDEFSFIQIDPARRLLPKGDSSVRKLLPSSYMVDIVLQGESEPKYRCFIRNSNRKGGIEAPVLYKDLSQGGDPNAPDGEYPLEEIWARAGGVTWYGLPLPVTNYASNVYARLARKPSGGWHTLDNRLLKFQYDDEYQSADPLSLKIMDWQRNDLNTTLSLGINLSKNYGDNRYSFQLPGTVPSGHYVLEVTNEKDETFYLRFEVE